MPADGKDQAEGGLSAGSTRRDAVALSDPYEGRMSERYTADKPSLAGTLREAPWQELW
ncbi:hypothetical protein BSY18_3742 (plasmid) [Blastomonas sp. RAC04]|jgi:hypothetical protein|nr:hypothetical protein BSY18_3742 [Blastomonas sp. RAC04]